MEYSSKLSILSNDVCRRLFNSKESTPQERKDEILDTFSTKILRSGYDVSQTRHILISGIRAFNGRVLRAKQSGRSLHRSAESSLGESSIYIYIPSSPFQCTPTPSPLRRGESSRSLKRQARDVHVQTTNLNFEILYMFLFMNNNLQFAIKKTKKTFSLQNLFVRMVQLKFSN